MEWCSAIVWYHPRYLIHLRPHVVTVWATIGTDLWAKMAENSFLTKIPTITSYSTQKYVQWADEWCSFILWYYPRCLLHLWPHIVTLWASIATRLWAKMAKNGWKLDFEDTYFHNLLFYTKICSMGRWVVFIYPMILLKVFTTLMTPYSYPMGLHSHSFMSKNGQKRLKTGFWGYLLP
jgi:hypothetical protein